LMANYHQQEETGQTNDTPGTGSSQTLINRTELSASIGHYSKCSAKSPNSYMTHVFC
jgi:hypothetical protein